MDPKRRLLDTAVEAAHDYLSRERSTRVGPTPAQIEALAAFDAVSLDEPIGAERALELLATVGSEATMRSTGGRYFGFVNGGVTDEALAASVIAGAWDQNVALPAMSPAASAIDAAAAHLIVDMLGLPHDATAVFCAGATIANITAIIAARDRLLAAAGWSIAESGLFGAPELDVVIGKEAHVSVHKALRIAGFGRAQIITVPADRYGRIDAAALPPVERPTLVLAQAGNVNTGHSDPFDAIADHYAEACASGRAWIHIDGAFGLWANTTSARRSSVAGVERAQSWATDGHKWLNVPYDCGIVICTDVAALHAAMRNDAAYVPTTADDRTLMNLGMQMSQAARGVPVWATLAARGRESIAASIEECCGCAEHFARLLEEAGAEVLAPVAINQVLVAFGDDETTDRVVEAIQADGRCWMGATTWKGRRAMRISVSDLSTTRADVEVAVGAILEHWHGPGARGD